MLAAFAASPRPRLLKRTDLPEGCGRVRLDSNGARVLCLELDDVRLWEVGAGAPLWSLGRPAEEGLFDAEGRPVLRTGRHLARYDHDGRVVGARVDLGSTHGLQGVRGDKAMLATAGGVWFVDLSGASESTRRQCPRSFLLAATHLDGELVMSCADGRLRVGEAPVLEWDPLLTGKHAASLLMEGPPGQLLAGTLRGRVALVDARTGRVVRHADSGLGQIRALRMSPDGLHAAALGERGGVRVLDLRTGAWTASLPVRSGGAVAWVDDQTLVTAGDAIRRWSLPAHPAATRFVAPSGLASAVYGPGRGRVALADGDGRVSVRASADGTIVGEVRWPGQVAKAAAFTEDGRYLFGANAGHAGVRVVETATWRELEVLTAPRVVPYRRVTVLQGGVVLAMPYHSEGPDVWRVNGWVHDASLHAANPMDLAASEDASRAVMLDEHGALRTVVAGETLKAEALFTLPAAVAAHISDDGERVVVARREGVRLTTRDGRVLREWPGTTVTDVAISGDGGRVIASYLDGRVRVWQADGPLLAVLAGHTERVASVALSGDEALTASWDRSARRWGLGVLDRPAAELAAEVEADWGMTIEDALSRAPD